MLPSLHAHLGMEQIFTHYNMVVESVNQHAADSLRFHNETRRLYQEIRHLNSQVKAWTRLLTLGSIQTIPPNSIIELQIERQRINNALLSVADQVESRRIDNLLQGVGTHLLQRHCQDHQQQLAPPSTGLHFQMPSSSRTSSSPIYPPLNNQPSIQNHRQSQNMSMSMAPPVSLNGTTHPHHGRAGSAGSTSSANSSNVENHPPPPPPPNNSPFGFSGFSNNNNGGQQMTGFFNGLSQGSYFSDSESSISSSYYPGN